MISGFEILKTRKLDSKLDISELENILNVEIPPLYKLFLGLFETGNSSIKWEEYINPINNYPTPSGSIKFAPLENKRELFFHGFFSLEELKKDWEIYSKGSKEWLEYGLLRIGGLGVGGGVFLGINNQTKERIYRVVWDWEDDFEKLAENVFEFVAGLVFVADGSNMHNYNYSQFYKNWGDDFWHIRLDV